LVGEKVGVMFCPQCREHWPGSGERPASKSQKAKGRICPACGVFLASERMESEFPPEFAARASNSSLTVSDVLRETSGGPVRGSQTPLDEKPRRERRSVWDHPEEGEQVPQVRRASKLIDDSALVDRIVGVISVVVLVLMIVGMAVYGHMVRLRPPAPAQHISTVLTVPNVAAIRRPSEHFVPVSRGGPDLRQHSVLATSVAQKSGA